MNERVKADFSRIPTQLEHVYSLEMKSYLHP